MLSEIAYHVSFGVHSGIPICCVRDWTVNRIMANLTAEQNVALSQSRHERIRNLYGEDVRRTVEYVPCHECINKGRFIHIHSCAKRRTRDCLIYVRYQIRLREQAA